MFYHDVSRGDVVADCREYGDVILVDWTRIYWKVYN